MPKSGTNVKGSSCFDVTISSLIDHGVFETDSRIVELTRADIFGVNHFLDVAENFEYVYLKITNINYLLP